MAEWRIEEQRLLRDIPILQIVTLILHAITEDKWWFSLNESQIHQYLPIEVLYSKTTNALVSVWVPIMVSNISGYICVNLTGRFANKTHLQFSPRKYSWIFITIRSTSMGRQHCTRREAKKHLSQNWRHWVKDNHQAVVNTRRSSYASHSPIVTTRQTRLTLRHMGLPTGIFLKESFRHDKKQRTNTRHSCPFLLIDY